MACCLTAPSHNLFQCCLENIGINPRLVSQENNQKHLPKLASEKKNVLQDFWTSDRGEWVKV